MTNQPRLIVFAGPNGSGKSTLTRRLLEKEVDIGHLLDPDAIARRINPENVQEAAAQAAREVINRQKQYLESGSSFAFETTLSGRREMRIIQEAKSTWFYTTINYVGLDDPTINVLRVAQRVSEGGHDVPLEDILRRYDRSMNNLPQAATFADRVNIFDNTESAHKLVLEIDRGNIVFRENDLPKWLQKQMQAIEKALEKVSERNPIEEAMTERKELFNSLHKDRDPGIDR